MALCHEMRILIHATDRGGAVSEHFEILADCPHCRVEGAVVEVYDHGEACCHFGVPVESRCRLCLRQTRGRARGPKDPETDDTGSQGGAVARVDHLMTEERCPSCKAPIDDGARQGLVCGACALSIAVEVVQEPLDLGSRAALASALFRWAQEEGYESAEEMLEVSFEGISLETFEDRIQKGERVETTFDVLGFLFAHMGGAGGAAGGQPSLGQPRLTAGRIHGPAEEIWGSAPTARIQLPTGRMPHRRNRALALISVMAADGTTRPLERQFIDRMLAADDLDPLSDDEIKIRRPHEVGPVGPLKDREALVEAMLEVAHIDDERDETEIRLIRAFARHWGVDPARIDRWLKAHELRSSSRLTRALVKVKALFLA